MGNVQKSEAVKGTVTVLSNSPGMPTGYGQQTEYMVERLKRHKIDVACQSNYGREGQDTEWKTPYGKVPEFARGYELYSSDVVLSNHTRFASQFPDQKDLLLTLYDTWVFQNPDFDKFKRILAWTPLDHASMPPNVFRFLQKENVLPIAMSPFGLEQMTRHKIDGIYIPHGIETKIFKPTYTFDGIKTRKFLGVDDKSFLVVMNSANKANKSIHRKAYGENLLAFKFFREKHPDSFLYIHTEPTGVHGGFNITRLAKSIGLPDDALLFPQPDDYKRGFSKEQLAAIYTAADVTLTTSYGEGFGLATIESQACGTPTITSGFAASKDLAGDDSYMVAGQPLWDEAQMAWFTVPSISAIAESLSQAWEARSPNKSQVCIDFAKDFDVEKLWREKWLPLLKSELAES
jgi:glycosyltransferase involved in cell wall biosynthesis